MLSNRVQSFEEAKRSSSSRASTHQASQASLGWVDREALDRHYRDSAEWESPSRGRPAEDSQGPSGIEFNAADVLPPTVFVRQQVTEPSLDPASPQHQGLLAPILQLASPPSSGQIVNPWLGPDGGGRHFQISTPPVGLEGQVGSGGSSAQESFHSQENLQAQAAVWGLWITVGTTEPSRFGAFETGKHFWWSGSTRHAG